MIAAAPLRGVVSLYGILSTPTDGSASGYNKGTIRSDIRYLAVSKDVRRHRLISISYISHGRCHGKGREFESRRPRHSFKHFLHREFHSDFAVAMDA